MDCGRRFCCGKETQNHLTLEKRILLTQLQPDQALQSTLILPKNTLTIYDDMSWPTSNESCGYLQ